ncbi:MAG TPA: glucose/sorbosone family PQQ-dependent dehydrogenase, partial [Nitrososphaera sp.]|nr:glucose/sorbosone family PQQ-dependent dehydrogenase [Nitrososphaera sp.]
TGSEIIDDTGLPRQEGFSIRVLATNLSAPHNILYGPDGALWITERVGKNITRVDPSNGSELSTVEVPNVHQSGGQDGLMGMAFDPNFNNTRYMYVAYTYAEIAGQEIVGQEAPGQDPGEEVDRRTKITRFTYDPATNTIGEPFDLITGLSGSVDHNSGRLIFGPDGKLYYTIGDQGNNQFSRYCFDIQSQELPTAEQVAAQDWYSTYQGKTLRMNPDGSIPEDNPEINGVRSHIFTYGHRNHQGIAAGPNGDLYVSEHGDRSDDELNRLQAGGNYGWPNVAGHNDEQSAYQYANWSAAENCEELEFNGIPPFPTTVPVMNESDFNATTANFVQPVRTFYTVDNDYNFSEPAGCGYVCWPTVAPSSLRLYSSDAIPGWNGTFLMTTLKAGSIFQLTPNENGTELAQDPVELFRSEDRYRDLTFSPDGSSIYVITDSSGPVQAIVDGDIFPLLEDPGMSLPTSVTELTTTPQNPGSVLEFKYVGNTTSGP